jgi:hypothetical protein
MVYDFILFRRALWRTSLFNSLHTHLLNSRQSCLPRGCFNMLSADYGEFFNPPLSVNSTRALALPVCRCPHNQSRSTHCAYTHGLPTLHTLSPVKYMNVLSLQCFDEVICTTAKIKCLHLMPPVKINSIVSRLHTFPSRAPVLVNQARELASSQN